MQSLAKIAIVGYTEDDVYLHTAPMCHIGGISSGLAMLMAGGCHVLIPKFEAKLAAQVIEENYVTSLITVPAIMADLISAFRLKESGKFGQSVKKILNGGGSLTTQLIEDATKCFPRAMLFSAYGMTETCSSLTFITLYDPAIENPDLRFEKIGGKLSSSEQQIGGICVGKPAPHVEMMSLGEDSSLTGRIMTRGPHVMIRYWGQTSTKAVDSSEQWFDTGDIGQIDAYGNLWLVGRRNGRIKSGGENVYPEEVEAILSQHPGISAVVIVGLPQMRLGEMVVACVRVRDSWVWDDINGGETLGKSKCHLSSEVLKQYCREKSLTGFKIPKTFVVWKKPFPRTSTGKLKREQVKRETMSMLYLHPLLSSSL